MQSVFYLNSIELNNDFINSVKTMFSNKNIEITISECVDETEYLTKSSKNKEKLLKAIENVKNNQNITEISLNKIKAISK